MANEYKNKELLVIDLGSYSIKALVGKMGNKGITVRKAVTVPLSPNIYSNGDVQNIQELTSVISDLVKDNGLKNHPVIFTISSTSSFARVLEVPSVKISEMKDVIDYEMQQYLPADSTAFITQFRLLSGAAAKPDSVSKVLVGVVPKMVAENLMMVAKNAELIPVALDIHPNALVKLFTMAHEMNGVENVSQQNIAFIELGHSLMDINIFEKGEFQFNRRIMIGGKNIDQRIERVMDVSPDDARMEKHVNTDINQEVFDYTDENRVFNSVKTGVDEWVVEIERVVKFYTSRKAGNKVDQCFIYGGGTGIAGIERYFAQNLGIPTEIIKRMPGVIDPTQVAENQLPLYLNAIGAIIRGEGQK